MSNISFFPKFNKFSKIYIDVLVGKIDRFSFSCESLTACVNLSERKIDYNKVNPDCVGLFLAMLTTRKKIDDLHSNEIFFLVFRIQTSDMNLGFLVL